MFVTRIRAVNGFVGEIIGVDKTGIKAFKIRDHCIEVDSGFGWKSEGALDSPWYFVPS